MMRDLPPPALITTLLLTMSAPDLPIGVIRVNFLEPVPPSWPAKLLAENGYRHALLRLPIFTPEQIDALVAYLYRFAWNALSKETPAHP